MSAKKPVRPSDELRRRPRALRRITGELWRGLILCKTRNQVLRQLQLLDCGRNASRCQMGSSSKRAPIVTGTAIGLMLGGQASVVGEKSRAAVHRADEQRRTGLAVQVRHPACRQQGAQNHRDKREMNCQMAQTAGHVSSCGNLMMKCRCRQCAMMAQPIGLGILELFYCLHYRPRLCGLQRFEVFDKAQEVMCDMTGPTYERGACRGRHLHVPL
jgi:hypothetical protein